MPWAKGHSGNPAGRRHELESEVRKLARKHTSAAIQTLVKCLAAESERTRVAAAEALLCRGWGQPKAEVDVTHHNLPIATTDDAALLALASAGGCVVASPKADQEQSAG